MSCSEIRDELSGILPGQLHPFGRRAAMRCLRGASDAWMSLAEEKEAQMGTERRPLPGFKKGFFYIHQTEKNSCIFSKGLIYLISNLRSKTKHKYHNTSVRL